MYSYALLTYIKLCTDTHKNILANRSMSDQMHSFYFPSQALKLFAKLKKNLLFLKFLISNILAESCYSPQVPQSPVETVSCRRAFWKRSEAPTVQKDSTSFVPRWYHHVTPSLALSWVCHLSFGCFILIYFLSNTECPQVKICWERLKTKLKEEKKVNIET